MKKLPLLLIIVITLCSFESPTYKIALMKYNGGGDWYANPTSLTNLILFANQNIGTNIFSDYETVDVGSSELYNYPFIHLTGHGNVVFSDRETENLGSYLKGGGFLHIDDNYGLDKFIRPQMKKIFPDLEFVELPPSHPIFHQKYDFPNGLPKIHEHDKKRPQAFALYYNARMICLYTYESDLGDGWEDQDVHKDSEATRQKALKMGANILQFVFNQ